MIKNQNKNFLLKNRKGQYAMQLASIKISLQNKFRNNYETYK